ncbi:MAG: PQQ-binding-like beta-propeller repeat protein [Gemmataceae bacterium]|nr:PQQ-like beta-propeller repeat protein [Gemmata sp.]MDW8196749.1 PQQ-binding-like beta-propeller repeat protein [Gemmataceae bacterium]
MLRIVLTPLVVGALTLTARAADWPQFLGPQRDNTTPETVEPWTSELKPLWKKPVGEAHSSPVVANGTVYLFYQPKGQNADTLAAFDAKTGTRKWEKSYDRAEIKLLFGNGPRATPTVAHGHVYTYGSTGILTCWNATSGAIVWKVDALKDFKASNLFFGTSASPLVHEDQVIVLVGGKNAGLVAFGAKSGKVVWQATDDPASYASPVILNQQIVALTGANVRGLSLRGQPLWQVPFKDKLNESSTTPIRAGGLIIASSVTAGSIAIKVVEGDGSFQAEKAWDNKDLTCYFSTPVVVGDYLYMVNGAATLTNPSITLRCVETKSGKVMWEKKNVGRYHAAILRCGPEGQERLLMLDDNGYLTLFAPHEKEYKELAKSKVCGPTWAHPALVDGRLYLRDDNELICLELKK